MAKEEENYITIVNLKEENQKLSRQLKSVGGQGQPAGNQDSAKGSRNDREVAKLSVENELLKKQVEELQAQVNHSSSGSLTKQQSLTTSSSGPASQVKEVEELKLKLQSLREENLKLIDAAKKNSNTELAAIEA